MAELSLCLGRPIMWTEPTPPGTPSTPSSQFPSSIVRFHEPPVAAAGSSTSGPFPWCHTPIPVGSLRLERPEDSRQWGGHPPGSEVASLCSLSVSALSLADTDSSLCFQIHKPNAE